MTIGQSIKELRIKKGMTQDDLAEATELSVRTIQRIENGEVDPRAYTLRSIATALNVPFETLIEDKKLPMTIDGKNSKWIPLIHLSGLFILIAPPIIIWILKRHEVEHLKQHAYDVTNYQLTISLFALPLMLMGIYPLIVLLFIYSQVIIIRNTVKVTANQSYKYAWNIRFFKSHLVGNELSVG